MKFKAKPKTGEWIDLSNRRVKNGYQLLMGDPIIPADLISTHDEAQAEAFIRRVLEAADIQSIHVYREGDE